MAGRRLQNLGHGRVKLLTDLADIVAQSNPSGVSYREPEMHLHGKPAGIVSFELSYLTVNGHRAADKTIYNITNVIGWLIVRGSVYILKLRYRKVAAINYKLR